MIQRPSTNTSPLRSVLRPLLGAADRAIAVVPLLLTFVIAAPASARQCSEAWVPGIGTVGLNNQVSALAVVPSGEVFVGGQFTTAAGILSNGLARYNPTTNAWRASPWGSTFALSVSPGGDVLVGGSTAIGTDGSYNIGKFDTDLPSVTPRSPLYFGLGGAGNAVNAIVQLPGALGDVFAGGNFTSAVPSLTAFRIARYSHTTGRWSNLPNPLGDGTSGPVNALALSTSGDVILGGAFAGVGLTAGASRIASYNPTTGAWSALGAGVNGDVNALAVLPSGEVFAGGAFTIAGGNAANRIARYNPTTNTWSALGTGTDGVVSALRLLADGDLLVGGTFTTAGGIAASNIARYSPATNTWSALGAGTNGAVRAIAVLPGGDVIIGGAFTSAGGSTANRIARYSPGTAAPIITTQPQPVVTVTGNSAVFFCGATGGINSGNGAITTPSYQWRKGGVAISAGTNPSAATPTLFLSNVQASDLGSYDCVATNPCGGAGTLSNAVNLSFVGASCGADFNNDGFVDFTDFDEFVAEFEAGC